MEPFFSADDIEGGYTTVTPKLFIGQPPFNSDAVVVANSDEARAVLVELGVDPEWIEKRLHSARYGLLSAYPAE